MCFSPDRKTLEERLGCHRKTKSKQPSPVVSGAPLLRSRVGLIPKRRFDNLGAMGVSNDYENKGPDSLARIQTCLVNKTSGSFTFLQGLLSTTTLMLWKSSWGGGETGLFCFVDAKQDLGSSALSPGRGQTIVFSNVRTDHDVYPLDSNRCHLNLRWERKGWTRDLSARRPPGGVPRGVPGYELDATRYAMMSLALETIVFNMLEIARGRFEN
jgi:hypothetical protein